MPHGNLGVRGPGFGCRSPDACSSIKLRYSSTRPLLCGAEGGLGRLIFMALNRADRPGLFCGLIPPIGSLSWMSVALGLSKYAQLAYASKTSAGPMTDMVLALWFWMYMSNVCVCLTCQWQNRCGRIDGCSGELGVGKSPGPGKHASFQSDWGTTMLPGQYRVPWW